MQQLRPRCGGGQQRLMAAMHTVEIADGDDAAAQGLGDFSFTGKNLHRAVSVKQARAARPFRCLSGGGGRRIGADLVANEPGRGESRRNRG